MTAQSAMVAVMTIVIVSATNVALSARQMIRMTTTMKTIVRKMKNPEIG
jgi:hypothetical protein